MINFIKTIVGLIVSVFASLIKGLGEIFNNVGTVMTPGGDSKKDRMQYNSIEEVEAARTKQTARKQPNENGPQTAPAKSVEEESMTAPAKSAKEESMTAPAKSAE